MKVQYSDTAYMAVHGHQPYGGSWALWGFVLHKVVCPCGQPACRGKLRGDEPRRDTVWLRTKTFENARRAIMRQARRDGYWRVEVLP